MKSEHKVVYRREPGDPLTERQKRNLEALAKKPDSEIDYSDIPEATDKFWENGVRGKWYRPVKQAMPTLATMKLSRRWGTRY